MDVPLIEKCTYTDYIIREDFFFFNWFSSFLQMYFLCLWAGSLLWRAPFTETAWYDRNHIQKWRECKCHESWPWTSAHSPQEVTHPSHWLSHYTDSYRSLRNYISHHPLHWHSCSHWSRLHLRTISQSPSPNHTHYISSGLPLALCRVLFSLAALQSVPSVSS